MIGQRATVCQDCGLPDPYDGQGDGIGSCDCSRCDGCGAIPGQRCCCDDPDCCAQPDRPIETVTAFADRGLL